MITLKEALKLSSDELIKLRKDLEIKIQNDKSYAYIEQLTSSSISTSGFGIPIAIKNNINVKDWETTSASNILKSYISPYNASVINNLEKAGLEKI